MQIIVISGKGGTGKTTIAASFADLSGMEFINIDCDVDASNLHLMFEGQDVEVQDFVGAKVAKVSPDRCTGCGKCQDACRFGALQIRGGQARVESLMCEGCGACTVVCPKGAIYLVDASTGKTIITDSKVGPISRAEMKPGAEGSGKLVTQVRKNAMTLEGQSYKHSILDGSPGVGCSVMASLTGCDYAVIVVEPSLSGFEDFERVYELVRCFEIEPMVVINKYDINQTITNLYKRFCENRHIYLAGQVPFDEMVERSINEGIPLVRYEASQAGRAIQSIWKRVENFTLRNGLSTRM